ncbi:MAG: glutamine synthetase family protein [Haloarculaceae archaeon]
MTDDPAAAMERRIEAEEIEHVLVEMPDINGISRVKQLSAGSFLEKWRDGLAMNLAVLVQTPRNDLPTGSGLAEEVGYADGSLRPDPNTLKRLPWRESAARVLCDLEFRDEPVAAAPRRVLRELLDTHVADTDLEFHVGSELEFYLLDSIEEGLVPATSHKHECVAWATEAVVPFYERLEAWAEAYGVPLDSVQHEHGPGQLEVLFEYGPASGAGDRAFDFKRLVKQTARLDDRYATFMAKPLAGESGSGYHLHVSAFEDGENAFAAGDGAGDDGSDGSDGEELSERGLHFLGGLLEHADALAAVGTPTLNGFKRFDPDGFVPSTASWGRDNRQTAVRVPTGTTRLESRISAADANPYLVVAATLAAGLHGMRAELDPGDPVEGNPAGRRPELPRGPETALTALEGDEVLAEYLGEEVIRAFVATKRRELESFRSTVTEWEREHYVETL